MALLLVSVSSCSYASFSNAEDSAPGAKVLRSEGNFDGTNPMALTQSEDVQLPLTMPYLLVNATTVV